MTEGWVTTPFLSSLAQDFIEEVLWMVIAV